MNLRKFKHDPAELLRQGEEIAGTRNIDPKHKFRMVAANMALSGHCTAAQAAREAGASRMTANERARAAGRDGFEALKDKKRGGGKSRLPAWQRQEPRSALQPPPPEKHKAWSGVTLSACIKERLGIGCSVRSRQSLFHKPGFSRIRPQACPGKGRENTPEREAFKKNAAK